MKLQVLKGIHYLYVALEYGETEGQKDRQEGWQVDRWTNGKMHKCTCGRKDNETERQTTDRRKDIQLYCHTDILSYRHTDVQTYTQTHIQIDGQTDRQAGVYEQSNK
jgi:hypothetical protein